MGGTVCQQVSVSDYPCAAPCLLQLVPCVQLKLNDSSVDCLNMFAGKPNVYSSGN